MAEPYLGEVKIFAFPRIPTGWSLCNGAILNVAQNQAVFALIGGKFGGDGRTTFALPDLRGRTPLGLALTQPDTTRSAYVTDGLSGGMETVTLTAATVPAHSHQVLVSTAPGTQPSPAGGLLASPASATSGSSTDFSVYLPASTWSGNVQLAPGTVSTAGGSQPHNNMQPFQVINFCIATSNAIWPSRW